MTALFTKNQKIQTQPKFKTTKELLENLYFQKAKHEKQFFDFEKELEMIQFRVLEIRNHQKHHKDKIFALEKEIQKHNKPKPVKKKYNYTSFYVFAGLLITIFIVALYFLFINFIGK